MLAGDEPFHREVRLGQDDAAQELPLATQGVRRLVWEGRYGSILIEVIGDEVFVNSGRVEPAETLQR